MQDADIQAWRDFTMALAEGKVNRDILAREAFAWGWNAALAATPQAATEGGGSSSVFDATGGTDHDQRHEDALEAGDALAGAIADYLNPANQFLHAVHEALSKYARLSDDVPETPTRVVGGGSKEEKR